MLLGLFSTAPRCYAQEAPPQAPVTAASVSFASGLYTFDEIARSLSTPDHPVRCAASLKNFAAFVHLNARPRAEALRLLGDGLDVALLPDIGEAGQTNPLPPGGLVLTRDPKIAAREALWRRRFEAGVSAHMQRKLQDFRARATAIPLVDARLHNQRLRDFYRIDSESESTPGEKRRLLNELAEALDGERKSPGANERLSDVWLQNSLMPTIAQVLAQGGVRVSTWPVPREWQPVLGRAIVESKQRTGFWDMESPLARQSTVDNYFLLTSWQFRRGSVYGLSFTPQAWLIPNTDTLTLPSNTLSTPNLRADAKVLELEPVQLEPPAGFSLRGPILAEGSAPIDLLTGIFEGTSLHANPSLPGLGAEAVTWLNAERTATQEYLRSDVLANKPLKTPLAPTVRAVSDAVAAWCRDTDAEAVMELSPEAEVLDDSTQPTAATLAAWALNRVAKTREGEGDCWSFRQEKGVLLVKDRLAFLDRLRPYPMAAFVPFARAYRERQQAARLGAQPEKLPSKLPFRLQVNPLNLMDYDLLKPYVMAVSADPRMPRWRTGDRALTPLLYGPYQGVQLERLDAAVALVFAWEQLTPRQQEDLIGPLPTGGHLVRTLPLSSLPPGARARLLDLLRAEGGGLDHPRLWGPQGREILRGSLRLWAFGYITPQPKREPGDPSPAPPTYNVTLRIEYIDDRVDERGINRRASDINTVYFRSTPKVQSQ